MTKSWKLSKLRKSKSKKFSKSWNSPNFNIIKARPSFLTSNAKITFNCLGLTFIKALIFCHFNPECHIQIKIDVLGYAISRILSQLTFETSSNKIIAKTDLGQWYLVAFFSKKMILTETWYKTYNNKLLAIVEDFKIW